MEAVDKKRDRLTRRTAGLLAARLPELRLHKVADPREGPVKWRLKTLLTTALTGMLAGCGGLTDVEDLTTRLSRAARKLLDMGGRVPDTTQRDLLVRVDPEEIRKVMYRQMHDAHRRKAIRPVEGLPIRAASLDGKATGSWLFDRPDAEVKYGQLQKGRTVVRTITACLSTAEGQPCLDAHPIPPETNECGALNEAVDRLLAQYDSWLDVLMYDSGGSYLVNADHIVLRGKHYVLCLRGNQPELRMEAERLLSKQPVDKALAQTVDPVSGEVVTRTLWLSEKKAGWNDWTHLRTMIRIQSHRIDKTTGNEITEDRYYLSSMAADRLTAAQWLLLIRRRWAVENECHNTFDTIFREDKRPWVMLPQGMVVVMMLRRIAYNLLSLFRSVTLRADRGTRPWKTLLADVYMTLLVAEARHLDALRRRSLEDPATT